MLVEAIHKQQSESYYLKLSLLPSFLHITTEINLTEV